MSKLAVECLTLTHISYYGFGHDVSPAPMTLMLRVDVLHVQDDCENYVRVMSKLSNGDYFVCGTNAFRPLCRVYSYRQASLNSHVTHSHPSDSPLSSAFDATDARSFCH